VSRVYGGWYGKIIGGMLGTPIEWGYLGDGRQEFDLHYYPTLSPEVMQNDDFDFQLVWLHALEEHGIYLTQDHLINEWLGHFVAGYSEYLRGYRNFRRGIKPPMSGMYQNTAPVGMGAPIRSDIWGMIAPGMPEVAAHYARLDATLDHALGDSSVDGEVFLAALEAAAFGESDLDRLIDIGLSFVSSGGWLARMITDTRNWYRELPDWRAVRQRIIAHYPMVTDFADSRPNLGLIVLALLEGKGDFEHTLLTAANCGFDADCTCATSGCIVGILKGEKAIPERWKEPHQGHYIAGLFNQLYGLQTEDTILHLAERTCAVGEKILASNPRPQEVKRQEKIWLEQINDDATVKPGKPKRVCLIVNSSRPGTVRLQAKPKPGWEIKPVSPGGFARQWEAEAPGGEAVVELAVTISPEAFRFGRNDLTVSAECNGTATSRVVSLLGSFRWSVLGPLPVDAPEAVVPGGRIDFTAAHPGKEGSPLGWQEYAAATEWDFPAFFYQPECLAYAVTYLHAQEERKLRLSVSCAGQRDETCIWLNGELVHEGKTTNSFMLFKPEEVRLRSGWNQLLVRKRVREGYLPGLDGPERLYIALTDLHGLPPEGIATQPQL